MSEQEHSSFFDQNRSTKKSHCIEVTQGVIFMEKNMRFGLFLGQLAITLRTNLLNSNNLISISKNVVFYAFGVVRIHYFLVNFD